MKKLSIVLALLLCTAMLYSGCALITNLTDPLPEEYIDGVKLPSDFPGDDFENLHSHIDSLFLINQFRLK